MAERPITIGGAQPAWLRAGARVHVRTGRVERDYQARVVDVEWPYRVYLEGYPGAVHPGRLEPLLESADPSAD